MQESSHFPDEALVLVVERSLYVALDQSNKSIVVAVGKDQKPFVFSAEEEETPFPSGLARAIEEEDESVFWKLVEALSDAHIKVERSSAGEYSISALPGKRPHQRACQVFCSLFGRLHELFPSGFWCETESPFSYPGPISYWADFAGGPRLPRGVPPENVRASLVVEICDTNPVSPNRLGDYMRDPYLQYIVVVGIGQYVPGNADSLKGLDVNVYERIPNGWIAASNLNSYSCTNYGQEGFTFSSSKLFYPYPAPLGAPDIFLDSYYLKEVVTGAIGDTRRR